MAEFMSIADAKIQATRLASGIREPITQEETEAMAANLRTRGIIDNKGIVRNG